MENKVSAIFEGLNSEQLKAVQCVEGPVLIVAGAGSGKTRVLTSRIANILEQGCESSRIMALTFTKKAASEMKERISLMVGEKKARRLYMGTFHSVFIRFLREYADNLGYPSSFTIYDTSDSTSAIKACIKELQLDDKIYKPKEVLSRISMAKNNLYTAKAYAANSTFLTEDARTKRPRLHELYTMYAARCRQAGVMDFDDILLNMNVLLKHFPDAEKAIADRFSYILVDEYQDTNYSQYLILKRLSQFHHNICVVGDDSQSIYAFRGAKIENILNFQKDFKDARIFRLERNYRSTSTIVDAANSLIAKNSNRIPKQCYAVGEKGDRIKILKASDEKNEATSVTMEILSRMHREKAQYQDFAILYRTNAQSRALEESLRLRNIPYVIYSGNSFFERAEIKDMMAYFKLAANPNDDEAFKRAIGKPARGIGDTSMSALGLVAQAEHLSLFKAAFSPRAEEFGLRQAALTRIKAFCELVDKWAAALPSTDAHEMALRIADLSTLYAFYKQDNSIEGLARVANIDELLNSVAAFVEERNQEEEDNGVAELSTVTLADFLENVSLLSNVDIEEDEEDASNKVSLMTVHSAKGLEYPYVFVTGMEENLFPSGGMLASPSDIEEERRLFYVALTRAKRAVYLALASTRMRNGKHESNAPSRFMKEIDSQYIENPLTDDDYEVSVEEDPIFGFRRNVWGAHRPERVQTGRAVPAPSVTVARRPSTPVPAADPNFVPSDPSLLREGQTVEHSNFGRGRILEISGNPPQVKARVIFDRFGEKQILLKYSKMRIIE